MDFLSNMMMDDDDDNRDDESLVNENIKYTQFKDPPELLSKKIKTKNFRTVFQFNSRSG